MTEDSRDNELQKVVYENALLNAIKHDGECSHGAIIGPVIGDNPSLRDKADKVSEVAEEIAEEVSDMSLDEQVQEARKIAPDKLESIVEDNEDDTVLPDLPNAGAYDQIRMRCAPNPNGAWHIGHARMPAVIGSYKDMYDGWFCVRFDDTDPSTKRPSLEAYDEILEDVEYLGFNPDAVFRASERLELYYDYARDLIEMGKAYTCDLSSEEFSEMKKEGVKSSNRDKNPEVVRKEFDDMVNGNYSEGDMVLRIKTDMGHKNPAIRDWVAFRIIDEEHPAEYAREYRCWPMLDFQSAIDDHEINITHIIRGIDLQSSVGRQGFVYDYFGWDYPEVIHWGHVDLDGYDIPISTSSIKQRIENGAISSWDDPRAPTLASLRRRGIKGEAITNAMIELGVSSTNVSLSLDTLYAKNRDVVDDSANRYFFLDNPVKMDIRNGPNSAEPPYHPEFQNRGRREIEVDSSVRLNQSDLPEIGERVWLKNYGPVLRNSERSFTYTDESINIVREEGVPVVQWIGKNYVDTTIRKVDDTVRGISEVNISDETVGNVVQFVRYGFVRVDSKNEDIVTYFTHN